MKTAQQVSPHLCNDCVLERSGSCMHTVFPAEIERDGDGCVIACDDHDSAINGGAGHAHTVA